MAQARLVGVTMPDGQAVRLGGKFICDYELSDKCTGVSDRKGIEHEVVVDGKEVTKYACMDCEMLFDND